MRELMDVIKSRRSTRAFVSKKLPPKEQIKELIEAAQWAPSGGGKFLWHFTVIYNADKSLKLAQAVANAANLGDNYTFYNAPVNIIVSYAKNEKNALLDGSAAIQNILLAAENLGLGSCWINQLRDACDEKTVRNFLTDAGMPTDHMVVGSVAVGYIEKSTLAKPRKEGVISFEE